jgi:dephospho-CoA kinase
MTDKEITTRLADTLVRCGVERGHLGRIDADNVARILLPIVRKYGNQRAAEELESAAALLTYRFEADKLDRRATDLRKEAS